MQYALDDLEKATVDVGALQRRRDRMVGALGEMGDETVTPAATFMCWSARRCPTTSRSPNAWHRRTSS